MIEVLVKSGQTDQKNDPLITLESDKSSVEVPATDEGKLIRLLLKLATKFHKEAKYYYWTLLVQKKKLKK